MCETVCLNKNINEREHIININELETAKSGIVDWEHVKKDSRHCKSRMRKDSLLTIDNNKRSRIRAVFLPVLTVIDSITTSSKGSATRTNIKAWYHC